MREIKKLLLPNTEINRTIFAKFYRMPSRIIARSIAHIRDSVSVATVSSYSTTFKFKKTFMWIANSEHEIGLVFVCVCVCVCVLPKIAILNIDQEDGSTVNCSITKTSFTIQLAKVSSSTR